MTKPEGVAVVKREITREILAVGLFGGASVPASREGHCSVSTPNKIKEATKHFPPSFVCRLASSLAPPVLVQTDYRCFKIASADFLTAPTNLLRLLELEEQIPCWRCDGDALDRPIVGNRMAVIRPITVRSSRGKSAADWWRWDQ